MPGPAEDTGIYLLDDDQRQVPSGGPAVIDADGIRQDVPLLVYKAISHVIEAMRAGKAVKITPLRPELPIDEAADAIGMARDDLRAYVGEGAIPFRSTEYVDWVRLDQLVAWENQRRAEQRAGVDEMLSEPPWEEDES